MEKRMDTAGHSNKRPIVVDFLVTLFITFCIGVVASLTLVGSVLLMAGDAHGEERCTDATCDGAPEEEMLARVSDLLLTHHLATKDTGLAAIGRVPARPASAAREGLGSMQPDRDRRNVRKAVRSPTSRARQSQPAWPQAHSASSCRHCRFLEAA
jgi:hypothetical protein